MPRLNNMALFHLKLCFYKDITPALRFLRGKFILKRATAGFRNCGRIIWTKYQSSVVFQK